MEPSLSNPLSEIPEKPSEKPAEQQAIAEEPYRNQDVLDNYLKNNPGASPEEFKKVSELLGF